MNNSETIEEIKLGRPKKILTPEEMEKKILRLKEQRARYAVNYYRKRVDIDPEYSKLLNDRSKRNTSIRKGTGEVPRPIGRPRKEL
jgi:hypothetical protein